MMVNMSSLIRPSRFGLLLAMMMATALTVVYRDQIPLMPSGGQWSLSSDSKTPAMWTCDRCLVNNTLCEKFGT